MTTNSTMGNHGDTELKVIEGEGVHGAAVRMDEEGSVGPGTGADLSAQAKVEAGAQGRGERGSADGAAEDTARPEHKKQLRERIEARRKELEASLNTLQSDANVAPAEMILGIQTSLQALDSLLTGGWDSVGAVEAQQLAQWLENNQYTGVVAKQDEVQRTTAEPAQPPALGAFPGPLGPRAGTSPAAPVSGAIKMT